MTDEALPLRPRVSRENIAYQPAARSGYVNIRDGHTMIHRKFIVACLYDWRSNPPFELQEKRRTRVRHCSSGGEDFSICRRLGLAGVQRRGRKLTVSLLVPQINLNEGDESPLSTPAILTTHRTSIGGPGLVEGQVQTYEVVALEGTASLVAF